MEFKLTKNQQQIFELVESSRDNILIFGKPGVGKSVLINTLVAKGQKDYTLAAPTGLAALNINGRTLHSLFRLPVSEGIILPSYNRFPDDDRTIANIKYNLRCLIIDEISMVRADVLDYIDRMMRAIRGNQHPFGGAQVIAVGDFFQLPPVTRREEMIQLQQNGYLSPFAFHAKVFSSFKSVQLNEVLRQNDPTFLEILDEARIGQVHFTSTTILNERVQPAQEFVIRLTGTNDQADGINRTCLSAIPDAPQYYDARVYGTWPAYPCEPKLTLKVGAQVMIKMNGADRPPKTQGEFVSKVVNGMVAVVTQFKEESIEVQLKDGTLVDIYKKTWERKVKEVVDGEHTEKVVAVFSQFPLSLAWAISMHKSQGQSYDQVHIDPSKIFAPGQLYVALSRCRSLEGLSLEAPVTPRKFFADKNVLEFFSTLGA